MRIAQIAPLIESVPPRLYGGTERIVSYLTEELVRLGHDVTLFASGDSQTSAELVPGCPRALRLDPGMQDPLPHNVLLLEKVRQMADRFDVLHFHIDYLHFPLFRPLGGRVLTTLHGRLDLPDLQPLYREFSDMRLTSISHDQRRPMPPVTWMGTVHHGLPVDLYAPRFSPEGYLAFLGRISPEKRPDRAIEIAKRAGRRLKIAAKVDKADRDYFTEQIAPLLDHPLIEFVGEIGEAEKNDFLGQASALLFPIDWPEPFGLAVIEAMACGTPVIAWRRGAVPEIVEDGVSGLLVDDMDSAVAAVYRIENLDRAMVRHCFETRFSATRMAQDYLAIYRRMISKNPLSALPPDITSEITP